MRQTWGSLLFMHWPIEPALLRPLVPIELDIDTHDGAAWIGVIPFTMWNIRRIGLPAAPGLSAFHELNVRTYVHHRGEPGVWFFSLDASKRIPVRVARAVYGLPYHHARITLDRIGETITYTSHRVQRGAPAAAFDARWTIGAAQPNSAPGSLVFFLTERYCLYAQHRRNLLRARIAHEPWPLHDATLAHMRSSMVSALGIPEPTGDPLLHSTDRLDVRVWKPEQVKPIRPTIHRTPSPGWASLQPTPRSCLPPAPRNSQH